MLRNTTQDYGWITIIMHWLVALTVVSMFALGLWMTELELYDAWYERGPDLHKSIGILLFITMTLRLAWRLINPMPHPLPTHSAREQQLAKIAHRLMYVLLFAAMLAGYLISTADGRAIHVFDLFSVPASFSGGENQEDIAGEIHELLAFSLIGLASLHALAALKHHFIDHDRTLLHMLGRSKH